MTDRKDRLNALGERWAAIREQGELNEKENVKAEIYELAFQLFPQYIDAMGIFFETEWPKFDPQKGSLYGLFANRLKKRKLTNDWKEQGIRFKVWKDAETGKNITEKIMPVSLQQKADAEGEAELEDFQVSQTETPEDHAQTDAVAYELLMTILALPELLHGRANNPQRLMYFRMFFTDSVTDIIRTQQTPMYFVEHERDLFQAIQVPFLDFFAAQTCRTVEEIQNSWNKLYGEIVSGRPMEELEHPLPGDIYCAYLEQNEEIKIGLFALSNQRAAYKQLLKERLC